MANLYSYSSGEARNEHDSPEYNSAAAVKAFGRTALAAALAYAAYTFWLIGRMFWFLHYSMTSAIRIDELAMMEEIRLFREGKYGIGYLWATYWGHRLLIPRLLMIADERFLHFSNTPLVVAGVFAQTLTTVRRRRGAALSARPRNPTVKTSAMPRAVGQSRGPARAGPYAAYQWGRACASVAFFGSQERRRWSRAHVASWEAPGFQAA